MTLYIDKKYANLLSPRLPLFKWTNEYVANFRCPICGDSEKSKFKKRGYFYPIRKDNKLMMNCKNCGAHSSFSYFLKQQDAALYKDYNFEKFKYNNEYRWKEKNVEDKEQEVLEKLESINDDPVKHLQSVRDLNDDHIAYEYILNRKIPFRYWSELYYTDNYQKWINDYVVKDKFEKPVENDPRIVIPFKNREGRIFAYQGRTLLDDPSIIRYITIRKREEGMLIYGFDKIEKNSDAIYVLEGPFDSMFLPNAVAVAGSALTKLITVDSDKLVFVFDNEPRNKDIIALMEKVIASNHKIVIWPNTVEEKDINKMIENGYQSKEVLDIIHNNTYDSALQSKLELNQWKKI